MCLGTWSPRAVWPLHGCHPVEDCKLWVKDRMDLDLGMEE